jgi:hypothetical protein
MWSWAGQERRLPFPMARFRARHGRARYAAADGVVIRFQGRKNLDVFALQFSTARNGAIFAQDSFTATGTTMSTPSEGDGPPSIPFSFTASAHSPTCDNISGQWIDSDNVGNSIGWDLNQSGASITGTLSFDDYRDFGFGLNYWGTISYSVSGFLSGGNSYSLSAVNPVPSIDNCGLPLAPSETENVALSGQACGAGSAAYTILDGGSTSGLARAMPGLTRTRVKTAVNAAARAALTSGTSTWTTYSPRFNVFYASYIPVDNIPGPTPCDFDPGNGQEPFLFPLRYKGDANRGTYRTTQAIFVAPDKQFNDNFFADAGPTRNYGLGSPANGPGSALSSNPASPDMYNGPYVGADEDNSQFDCHYWNDRGKADVSTMQSHSVTFSGSNQAVVTLSGSGQDPLEPKIGGIKWNATITLDSTNPDNPTAQVSITHTCYPAHTVKVNGVTVIDDQPSYNNTAYLIACLTLLPQKTTTTGVISVPSH